MLRPPKWTEFPKYPVIAAVAISAIAVTIAWWAKADISALFENAEIRRGQLWRLITSIFSHLDVLHLAFNIYWFWAFGTIVEKVYGHIRTVLLLVLFAVGPNSLDFAFAQGGVGLSGVGYGLFGLLWVLSRRDDHFRDAVDQRTVVLFIGWFVFCVATTLTHTWVVANVAHGVGALLGILVGLAITQPARRMLFAASAAGVVFFGLWGGHTRASDSQSFRESRLRRRKMGLRSLVG
jgi:membrane associated rhomboid family serine protease